MSTELMNSKDRGKYRQSWLWYGGEFLTIFLALTVLTGRVYAQSYWNVFGLSTEFIDTNFVNYAVMSPNAAIASTLMAVGTVAIVRFVMWQPADFIGNLSPRVAFIIGYLATFLGLYSTLILRVNSSTWIVGTAGMVFGLGFLITVGGATTFIQATLKLSNKELSKFDKFFIGWVKKVPFILVQMFFIVAIVSSSLWGILDTSQKFGANEAKFMYNMRPIVTLQLDSPKGFEDLSLTSSSSGATTLQCKIITEANGFLYISTGLTQPPPQLHVRAIPVSRVQALQYEVGVNPIGQ